MRPPSLVCAFVAVVLAVSALPAAAHAGAIHIVSKEVRNWCLDSNAQGDVYINPCQDPRLNPYQLWESWEGGWTRNVGTGLCLQGIHHHNPAVAVQTRNCIWDFALLHWRHWNGGWKQRQEYRDAFGTVVPALCLVRVWGSVHDVTGKLCTNPNGPNPASEEWFYYFVT